MGISAMMKASKITDPEEMDDVTDTTQGPSQSRPNLYMVQFIFSLSGAAAAAWAACPNNEGANTAPLKPARLIPAMPFRSISRRVSVEENRLLLAVFISFSSFFLSELVLRLAHKQMQHHAQSIFHVGPCRWDIRCPELFLKKTD